MSNHNLFTTPFHVKADLDTQLRQNPELYRKYQTFSLQLRQRLDNFLLGKATLPFTYDPFFKKFFSPDVHPTRLSRLLSAILGMKMKVARIPCKRGDPKNPLQLPSGTSQLLFCGFNPKAI